MDGTVPEEHRDPSCMCWTGESYWASQNGSKREVWQCLLSPSFQFYVWAQLLILFILPVVWIWIPTWKLHLLQAEEAKVTVSLADAEVPAVIFNIKPNPSGSGKWRWQVYHIQISCSRGWRWDVYKLHAFYSTLFGPRWPSGNFRQFLQFPGQWNVFMVNSKLGWFTCWNLKLFPCQAF